MLRFDHMILFYERLFFRIYTQSPSICEPSVLTNRFAIHRCDLSIAENKSPISHQEDVLG